MNEKKLIQAALKENMPDIESVRQKCLDQEDSSQRKARPFAKWLLPAGAFAVIALTVILVALRINNHNNMAIQPATEFSKNHTSSRSFTSETQPPQTSSEKETVSKNEQTEAPSKETETPIHINRIPSIPMAKSNIALFKNDYISMSREELCTYYVINVFPDVPKDLKQPDQASYGIYRRNSGSGSIYFDQNGIQFSNENNRRSVNVEMSKVNLPLTDVAAFDVKNPVTSDINGTKAYIFDTKEGQYYAAFSYQKVNFRIFAEGLSQKELISVLQSLTK